MFLGLFVLWLIFVGKITLESVILGLIISILMYIFARGFLKVTVRYEKTVLTSLFGIIKYIGRLIVEVVKANVATAAVVLKFKEEPHPVLVRFRSDLTTNAGRLGLANSITLTPGTITVDLQDEEGIFLIHALDVSMSEDLDDSCFTQKLKKLEDSALKVYGDRTVNTTAGQSAASAKEEHDA